MHHAHIKKQVHAVLKLDFQKAYDKVNSGFLLVWYQVSGFSDQMVYLDETNI